MRRLPAEALWYALALLAVVGLPVAAVFLLGTPEPALPSDWSEARGRIDDGTYPAGYIVDIVSLVLLLPWGAGLGYLVMAVLKRFRRDDGAGDETGVTDVPAAGEEGEPGEPWYRQGPPIFDEPFSDEYARVVVPPDEAMAEDGPQESLWQPAAMGAEALGESDALADGMVSDAEIIGGPAGGPDPDEPPMIVPVRAYYFSRAGDTLRSVSAQFLQTPMRWEELRSLNVASPGVAAVEADTLLPPGTALALPGDPLPWGKPDPVYLWTLAEKFLFTAWGREPAPEEVVPFWRGLTGGAQLEAGAPPFQPEHLAAPTEPPASDVEPESVVTEPPMPGEFVTPSPAAAPAEPLAAPTDLQPPPVAQPPYDQPPYESPVPPTHEPVPPGHEPAYEPVPPPYESPVPPSHEPAYESPVSPTQEPAAFQPPPPVTPPYESPVPPGHEPAYESPVPPTHEPPPPVVPQPGMPDLGPMEPEEPYVEAEAPRMPTFMPSLTGAETAAPAPEADMVSSNRGLAGTAIGDAMMLWQLSRLRRRRGGRPDAADPMEESLRQSARVDTLSLIEAAMRHLRAVTVGQLREKPAVLAVRVGTYGFEVLLSRPVQAPDGWQTASGGYVLELPQGVTAEDLEAAAQGPTLCPALVPVGDTLEGPLLLNVEEIGCLIVSGPGSPSVNLLNAVVGTLGSSPLAGDIRIITVGLDTPAGLPGWERVHSTSFDSPQLEELLYAAHTGTGASLDVLVVGPGNDLLIQRAGQVATTPGSRLALIGATSSVAARWPWRIHVDETTTAVVHPIACTMAAAQAVAPAMSQLLSEAADPSLLAPPRF
ncbi:MAG: hypothetical protein F4139_02405 [Gemmatimonadetes bacterium]|nr:hypothetical protein [Gemmatimonadota bacterium]